MEATDAVSMDMGDNMKKSKKMAGNRKGAWLVQEKEMSARHFGGTSLDRLDLEEAAYGFAGKMKVQTGFLEADITDYERTFDEESGIVRCSYQWQGHPVNVMAFVSCKENLVYYEIASDYNCLNLTVNFEPELKSAYCNHNMGGFYFETKNRKTLLIGKGELKADGFPKADEEGIHIKNASQAAFRIYMKSEAPQKGVKTATQAVNMQMAMNRYLAKTDDISREGLIKAQEEKQV